MPYVAISSKRLDSISLFGFTIEEEDDDFLLIRDSRGLNVVSRSHPVLWFDDEELPEAAIQLGAQGIYINS